MKRICVDQDQVLADLLTPWLDRYNNDYNDNLKREDITGWDFHDLVSPECGKKIYKYLDDPDLFENLPVVKYAKEVLKRLSYEYEIFICTAPWNPENIIPKYKWLQKHFPFVDEKNYVFTINKSIIRADYMIDDRPKNLEDFEGYRMLFDAPHNKQENRFDRFYSWDEIDRWFSTVLTYI